LASTNQTGSLGLPQWEGADTVEHGDFNAAFAKIDEAIRQINEAIEGRLRKKIKDVTITEETDFLQLTLSEEELEGVAELELIANLSSGMKQLKLNGKGGYTFTTTSKTSSSDFIMLTNGVTRLALSCREMVCRPAQGLYFYTAEGSSFSSLNSLDISASETYNRFKPGDHIVLWGTKR